MAYRKQWYTYGAKSNSVMDQLNANFGDEIKNGDTYFSTTWGKPMYCNDLDLQPNVVSADKIWLNEDMIWGVIGSGSTPQIGSAVCLDTISSWAEGLGGVIVRRATSADSLRYVGVVANGGFYIGTTLGIAIQGMYNVKFTSATETVTAGNLAVLSSNGEAVQVGSAATLGVIGVIMETKTLGVDKLARVMIQSFSSK
jgi:hypothetical protein